MFLKIFKLYALFALTFKHISPKSLLDGEWREMPKSRKNDSMSVSYADSVQLLFETQDGWYSYARDGEYGEKYAAKENDFLRV